MPPTDDSAQRIPLDMDRLALTIGRLHLEVLSLGQQLETVQQQLTAAHAGDEARKEGH